MNEDRYEREDPDSGLPEHKQLGYWERIMELADLRRKEIKEGAEEQSN